MSIAVRFRVPVVEGLSREQMIEQLLGKPLAHYQADVVGTIITVAPSIDGETLICEAEITSGTFADHLADSALKGISAG